MNEARHLVTPLMGLLLFVTLLARPSLGAPDDGKYAQSRGQLDGALYVVVKPAEWNHRLFLHQHGLGDSTLPLAVDINTREEPYKSLLAQGWMVAASSYRRSGFVVRDAVEDVQNLYHFIVKTHGKPTRTLLMGESMGGAVTTRLIEAAPREFDGALVLGTALRAREKDLADLTNVPKAPVIFMTNQSEVDQSANYVKAAKGTAFPSALWIVERDGHVKFTEAEALAAVTALDRWVDGESIEMDRKFAIEVKDPPSTARFEDHGAQGIVRQVGGSYGNLSVSFVEADFKQLKIAKREVFEVESGGKTYPVTYGDTFTDVATGKWVCFREADGYYTIAICFGNAAKTAGVRQDDKITIRKVGKSGG